MLLCTVYCLGFKQLAVFESEYRVNHWNKQTNVENGLIIFEQTFPSLSNLLNLPMLFFKLIDIWSKHHYINIKSKIDFISFWNGNER